MLKEAAEDRNWPNTNACLRSRSSLYQAVRQVSFPLLCLDVNWPIHKAIVWVILSEVSSIVVLVTYN